MENYINLILCSSQIVGRIAEIPSEKSTLGSYGWKILCKWYSLLWQQEFRIKFSKKETNELKTCTHRVLFKKKKIYGFLLLCFSSMSVALLNSEKRCVQSTFAVVSRVRLYLDFLLKQWSVFFSVSSFISKSKFTTNPKSTNAERTLITIESEKHGKVVVECCHHHHTVSKKSLLWSASATSTLMRFAFSLSNRHRGYTTLSCDRLSLVWRAITSLCIKVKESSPTGISSAAGVLVFVHFQVHLNIHNFFQTIQNVFWNQDFFRIFLFSLHFRQRVWIMC